MGDGRTLRQRLEAMALQTSQSPHEAATARRLLARLFPADRPTESTSRVLSRDAILQSDDDSRPRRTRRVHIGSRVVEVDEDDLEALRSLNLF